MCTYCSNRHHERETAAILVASDFLDTIAVLSTAGGDLLPLSLLKCAVCEDGEEDLLGQLLTVLQVSYTQYYFRFSVPIRYTLLGCSRTLFNVCELLFVILCIDLHCMYHCYRSAVQRRNSFLMGSEHPFRASLTSSTAYWPHPLTVRSPLLPWSSHPHNH